MAYTATQRARMISLLEPLQERFPALRQCLPLALNTTQSRRAEIAAEFQVNRNIITKAFWALIKRPAYQEALAKPGTMRYTLEGEPVEPVSDEHRSLAQDRLDRAELKRQRAANAPPPIVQIPLTPEIIQELLTMAIPGKLDVIVKINALPKIKGLGHTVVFVVEAEGQQVLVELKNKTWSKLRNTTARFPQWIMAINGKMGEPIEGGFRLKEPKVQIFEKKPKAAPEDAAAAPPAPSVSAPSPPAPTEPAPASTPTPSINAQKPVLKLRKPTT